MIKSVRELRFLITNENSNKKYGLNTTIPSIPVKRVRKEYVTKMLKTCLKMSSSNIEVTEPEDSHAIINIA